jgi:dsDNA-binding SOS-regulon protein
VAEANNELCTFHYDYSNNLPNGDVKRRHLQQELIHMKEALRIRSIIYGPTNPKTIENQRFISHLEFLNLVNKENRDDDEKKLMFQEYLSLDLKEGGIDIDNMVVLEANDQLATIYLNSSNKMTGDAKRAELRIALSHAKEAVRISTKLHGTNNPQTIQYQTVLSQLRFLFLAS